MKWKARRPPRESEGPGMESNKTFYIKKRKDLVSLQGLSSRTKGMGEIFHGQTKGYMFVCDQLHDFYIIMPPPLKTSDCA
ncbi:hypothetical protein SD77_1330 [Bacillus badius]|uniref:Uncharacterized protein n=1 Tax=Bacillus badius TaxID=1455 RepID=A0ABR5ASC4_BACBA|nr:hypothetical protein SD77_1330 [Bacillus badius]